MEMGWKGKGRGEGKEVGRDLARGKSGPALAGTENRLVV